MSYGRCRTGVLAIALAALWMLSACGGSGLPKATPSGERSAPGVAKDTITISVSAARSGAYGQLTPAMEQAGIDVWAKEVNAAGGIHGRRVKLVKVDNQLTPEGAVAACQEEQSNGSLMVLLSAGSASEATCLDKAGIPVLYGLVDQVDPQWKSVFYIQSIATSGRAMASYVAKTAPQEKVGIIHLKDSPYGVESNNALVKRAKDIGVDIVDDELIASNQSSFVPELRRLKDAGATTVFAEVTAEIAGITRDAASIGYKPHIVSSAGVGSDIFAQTFRDALRGITVLRFTAGTDTSAFSQYAAKVKQLGGGKPSDIGGTNYASGLLLQKALEAAGPNPTRDSVVKGFRTIKDFDTGILPPISWTNGLEGTQSLFVMECCTPEYTWKAVGEQSAGGA